MNAPAVLHDEVSMRLFCVKYNGAKALGIKIVLKVNESVAKTVLNWKIQIIRIEFFYRYVFLGSANDLHMSCLADGPHFFVKKSC